MTGDLSLPIDGVLPTIGAALDEHGTAVITAAPGAGKSTRVPPSVVSADNSGGGTLLLQPRRVAARSLARRIADEQGWSLGAEVGWQIRHERKGGPDTRLWVITEGILSRRFLNDPTLDGISTVILDEFHERSIHADLALAWIRELRRELRPDIRLLVMSATIDPQPVSNFLGGAPVIDAAGRAFPVQIEQRGLAPRQALSEGVADAVRDLDAETEGDILAFLPGVGEIDGTMRALAGLDREVLPLHGSLGSEAQDEALRPSPGRRRVICATNVAETSLTLPGITAVVDSGLARIARFDPDRGLEELRKERIGRFSADQRSGRAGRTAPGRCIRLWSRLEDQRLAPSVESELARSDLAPLCLQLRLWYGDDARTFPWFEAPEAGRLDAAEQLLQALGFIESAYGPLTARGRYLAKLPLHPRLSRLLLEAEQAGALGLGAAIAACLGERDLRQRSAPRPSRARVADVEDDLFLLHEGPRHPSVDRGAWHEVDRVRKDLLRRWGSRSSEGPWYTPDDFEELLPRLVLAAYPDRVSRRSAPGSNRIQILGGVAAELDEGSCCQVRPGQRDTGDLVLAVSLRGLTGAKGKRVRCDSASSLDEALLEAVHPGALTDAVEHRFDASRGRVSANRVRRFGSLALAMSPCPPEPYAAAELLADALHKDWPGALRRRPAVAQLLDRWLWLRQRRPELDLPNPVDPELVLPQWCHGHIALDSLPDPSPQLTGGLSWEQSQALDRLAPKELTLPNGRHCPLAYPEVNEAPTLSLRIQDCFGWPDGPRIDDGRCPVRLELLAPNGRPQQITEDLAGFWAGSYALVRKDLRGRYPKHPWPENPAEAEPVLRRRRGGTKGKS